MRSLITRRQRWCSGLYSASGGNYAITSHPGRCHSNVGSSAAVVLDLDQAYQWRPTALPVDHGHAQWDLPDSIIRSIRTALPVDQGHAQWDWGHSSQSLRGFAEQAFAAFRKQLLESVAWLSNACSRSPYMVSGISSAIMMVTGDIMAQRFMAGRSEKWDHRRTMALGAWGLVWYGGPQQLLWIRLYPRLIGRGTNLQAIATSVADCIVNQCVAYVPCFYVFTGLVRGDSLGKSFALLQKEYFTTISGQTLFWLPVQSLNFRYVPVHMQTFVVSVANIVNKTWLSWLSNRERSNERK